MADEEKEETIFEQMDRFIDSINDEIRSDDCDNSSIDFWLFKLKNRVNILKTSDLALQVTKESIEESITDQQRSTLYSFITWYNAIPKVNKNKLVYTSHVDKFLKE